MENNHNAKSVSGGEPKPIPNPNNGDRFENPNPDNHQVEDSADGSLGTTTHSSQPSRSSRTPFTNLSQVDADLALARTLQEQETAYMMLRMNNDGSDYGSYLQDDEDNFNDFHDDTDGDGDDDDDDDDGEEESEGTDVENDEDAFDVHDHHDDHEEDNNPSVEFDPAVYSSDEAYARALQDAEERDMAARLLALAGLGDHDDDDDDDSELEDHGVNSQDAWEEVDPDELSYEVLIALGEVIGTESRGLSADTIASLPSVNYKTGSSQNGSNDSCVICRLDYEDGENLTLLSCKHSYHPECINNWLNINKVCPICSAEVSTAGNS